MNPSTRTETGNASRTGSGVRRARRSSAFTVLLLMLALPPVIADDELGSGPAPSPDLSPERVVEIVVDALQRNERVDDDAGIATVWRFASPGNRRATGPQSRFTQMIKRGFPDMLEHESSRFDAMQVEGDKALQAVWLMLPSGSEVGYAFQLGRQQGGEYDGMWMTESVLPLGKGARSGTRI